MKPFVYANDGNNIYQVNLDTGKATLVVNAGQALEIACHNNTLYGINFESNSRLLKYDPSSKQFVSVGNTNIPGDQLKETGMAGHSGQNSLYVVTTNKLFEINPTTGGGKEVASFTSEFKGNAAIAIAPDGKAYIAARTDKYDLGYLATVNLSTGVITNIGTTGLYQNPGFGGLAFHGNVLYGLGKDGQLTTLDPNTGKVVSRITTNPASYWGSMALSPVSLTDLPLTKSYKFKNPASGLMLDVVGAQAKAGTIAWGHSSNDTTAQKWTITPDGVIKTLLGDFALDLRGYEVVINPVSGAATQKWEITPKGVIKNKSNNHALVLSAQQGYQVVLAYPIDESNPKANEKWEIINL